MRGFKTGFLLMIILFIVFQVNSALAETKVDNSNKEMNILDWTEIAKSHNGEDTQVYVFSTEGEKTKITTEKDGILKTATCKDNTCHIQEKRIKKGKPHYETWVVSVKSPSDLIKRNDF